MRQDIDTLRQMMTELKKDWKEYVPEIDFFRAIVRTYGTQTRIRREIAQTVHLMGYAHPTNTGVWVFDGEFKEKEKEVGQEKEKKV